MVLDSYNSSKTCMQSVASSQIQIIELWLELHIYDTVLYIGRHSPYRHMVSKWAMYLDAQEQEAFL